MMNKAVACACMVSRGNEMKNMCDIEDNSFPFVKGVKKNKATTPFLLMEYFDRGMKHKNAAPGYFEFYVKTSWFLLCYKTIGRIHRHTHICTLTVL